MKLECFKEKLREAAGAAERITGKNLSLSVLSNIMLEAKGRSLCLKATNLDLGIEIALPAKVVEEGNLMVSGTVLSGFLSNLQRDEKITLETQLNNLSIVTPHASGTLNTHPTEDFPLIPKLEGANSFTLPVRHFLAGLKGVSFAASYSDIKPEIASVYVYQQAGDLWFVATDSFRLAEKRVVLEKKVNEELKLILPIRNVGEIMRTFEREEGELTISYNQNQVAFATEGVYLTSRLVDGIFPDYKQIMPSASQTEVVVLKQDLVNALKLANVFTDKLNQVTLKVAVSENSFQFYSKNTEVGETKMSLEATLEGEDVEASYNVKYILDCFAALTSDSVVLRFNTKNRPLALAGVGDNSFTYLVMPLNR